MLKLFKHILLAGSVVPALFPLGAHAAGQYVSVSVTEPSVNNYSPNNYINPTGYGSHYVNAPSSGTPKVLVVFLGGSGTNPSSYTSIVDEAALAASDYKTNYAAVGLAYIDGSALQTIGIACTNAVNNQNAPASLHLNMDECFTQLRG